MPAVYLIFARVNFITPENSGPAFIILPGSTCQQVAALDHSTSLGVTNTQLINTLNKLITLQRLKERGIGGRFGRGSRGKVRDGY